MSLLRLRQSASTRTLALGEPGSMFYRSIRTVMHHFGDVVFRHEKEFASPSSLIQWVRSEAIDQVLMPNPYGNPLRLACYQRLRQDGVTVIASDRGALPDAWFFDYGFNQDSPSYRPEAWAHPLSDGQQDAVQAYLAALRSSNATLESQGRRQTVEDLREQLDLDDRRLVFVPLQRPLDTVVRYFSGAVEDMNGFVRFVDRVAALLEQHEPGRWALRLKKHPLELEHPRSSTLARYANDETHVHDLIEASHAVLALNSGVGLLSICFGKPTLNVGDSFYAHEGLAQRVETPEQATAALLAATPPDPQRVEQFVHHLTKRVYSFADFEGQVQQRKAALQRITHHLEFRELRILGQSHELAGDRVLVVSPVIPSGICRGSQSRVDTILRAMIATNRRVSLVVLNRAARETSRAIVRQLRATYPSLDEVEVRPHHAIEKGLWSRVKRACSRVADVLTLGVHRVANLDTCPLAFRRCVGQLCEQLRPHILWVNYAKMAPCVPQDFSGVAVVDTHDHQTQFLIEDQTRNRKRRHVNRRIFERSERTELQRFHRIVAINSHEAEVLRRLAPTRAVICIPAFAEGGSEQHRPYTRDALLVASISNFNVKGLRWFYEQVFPLIRRERPSFVLTVVGNIDRCRELDVGRMPGVEFLGVIPHLDDLYQEAACVVAPLLGGAGMKIKVVEALAQGKAIVATPRALEGIRAAHDEHLLVAEEPDDFAGAVLRVLKDRDTRRRLEQGASELHHEDHSPGAIVETLERALGRRCRGALSTGP